VIIARRTLRGGTSSISAGYKSACDQRSKVRRQPPIAGNTENRAVAISNSIQRLAWRRLSFLVDSARARRYGSFKIIDDWWVEVG
jgi:hypothetical protein